MKQLLIELLCVVQPWSLVLFPSRHTSRNFCQTPRKMAKNQGCVPLSASIWRSCTNTTLNFCQTEAHNLEFLPSFAGNGTKARLCACCWRKRAEHDYVRSFLNRTMRAMRNSQFRRIKPRRRPGGQCQCGERFIMRKSRLTRIAVLLIWSSTFSGH